MYKYPPPGELAEVPRKSVLERLGLGGPTSMANPEWERGRTGRSSGEVGLEPARRGGGRRSSSEEEEIQNSAGPGGALGVWC